MAELQSLQDLFDMGFIHEEEYLRRKAELLGGATTQEPTIPDDAFTAPPPKATRSITEAPPSVIVELTKNATDLPTAEDEYKVYGPEISGYVFYRLLPDGSTQSPLVSGTFTLKELLSEYFERKDLYLQDIFTGRQYQEPTERIPHGHYFVRPLDIKLYSPQSTKAFFLTNFGGQGYSHNSAKVVIVCLRFSKIATFSQQIPLSNIRSHFQMPYAVVGEWENDEDLIPEGVHFVQDVPTTYNFRDVYDLQKRAHSSPQVHTLYTLNQPTVPAHDSIFVEDRGRCYFFSSRNTTVNDVRSTIGASSGNLYFQGKLIEDTGLPLAGGFYRLKRDAFYHQIDKRTQISIFGSEQDYTDAEQREKGLPLFPTLSVDVKPTAQQALKSHLFMRIRLLQKIHKSETCHSITKRIEEQKCVISGEPLFQFDSICSPAYADPVVEKLFQEIGGLEGLKKLMADEITEELTEETIKQEKKESTYTLDRIADMKDPFWKLAAPELLQTSRQYQEQKQRNES